MKNFIQDGEVLSLAAPYDRTSGQGALVGSIFGVAVVDVLSGATGQFVVVGVFEINKLSTDVVTAGAKIYWDDTNKRCTVTASGNTLIGAATEAAGNGVATVKVRLNGTV